MIIFLCDDYLIILVAPSKKGPDLGKILRELRKVAKHFVLDFEPELEKPSKDK